MSYTKGKWMTSIMDGAENPYYIIECGNEGIAEVYGNLSGKYNAQLIATAPKLLAVLQQTLKDYKEYAETGEGDLFDERLGANMTDAEAVIQEATT